MSKPIFEIGDTAYKAYNYEECKIIAVLLNNDYIVEFVQETDCGDSYFDYEISRVEKIDGAFLTKTPVKFKQHESVREAESQLAEINKQIQIAKDNLNRLIQLRFETVDTINGDKFLQNCEKIIQPFDILRGIHKTEDQVNALNTWRFASRNIERVFNLKD